MTANERKDLARGGSVGDVGRTTTGITGMAAGSGATVVLGRRDWEKIIDALRNAARYLHDPPDPALLRIANDIEKKLPEHETPK